MAKSVVILGGNIAGLHIAHGLLKGSKDVKVTIITKNSHFFWNLATCRSIIPDLMKEEDYLIPLDKALGRYPKERWEVILGTVVASDFAAKTVTYEPAAGTAQTLSYDQVVLATGSRYIGSEMPWKADNTYEELVGKLHSLQQRLPAAKHIVVGGAGATGVEVAGELGSAYGKEKEIVLLAGGKELLDGDVLAPNAAAELKKLNVAIRYESHISGSKALPDGKTEVTLTGGQTIVTDVYLSTMGQVPNSEYVAAEYKDAKGLVVVDEFHQVKGVKDAWAVGDIVGKPRQGFFITQTHSQGLLKNVLGSLAGKPPTPVKGPPIDVLAMTTGRYRGVGRIGSWFKMFSFMVYQAKGKSMATNMVPSYITGAVA